MGRGIIVAGWPLVKSAWYLFWTVFFVFAGRKHKDNCAKTPKTCAILDQFSDAVGCKRGQVGMPIVSNHHLI